MSTWSTSFPLEKLLCWLGKWFQSLWHHKSSSFSRCIQCDSSVHLQGEHSEEELFSFQQDVAATKKNPMCWLRRAEARYTGWRFCKALCIGVAESKTSKKPIRMVQMNLGKWPTWLICHALFMFAENSCAGLEVPGSTWKDMSQSSIQKTSSALEKGFNKLDIAARLSAKQFQWMPGLMRSHQQFCVGAPGGSN